MFTTHEQLAVSEEREAELAAAVQEAKQSAAAGRQALAANQQAVKPQPSSVLHSEQVSLIGHKAVARAGVHTPVHIHSMW